MKANKIFKLLVFRYLINRSKYELLVSKLRSESKDYYILVIWLDITLFLQVFVLLSLRCTIKVINLK